MTLNVAFKEWAVVCQALAAGRQSVILRKGGIAEEGGIFRPEYKVLVLSDLLPRTSPASSRRFCRCSKRPRPRRLSRERSASPISFASPGFAISRISMPPSLSMIGTSGRRKW